MLLLQAAACVICQQSFTLPVYVPQLRVGNIVDALIPEGLIIDMGAPIGVDIAAQQLIYSWCNPGEGMHAVGDIVDGYLVDIDAGPEELPHLARDCAVQLTDAIMLSRQSQRQHGHAVCRAPALILAGYL